MKQTDKLIKLFEVKIEESKPEVYKVDKALLYLLEEHKEVLPELDFYFHKAFRQIDITSSGKIDMAIWHLIGLSDLFWEAFNEVTEYKYSY